LRSLTDRCRGNHLWGKIGAKFAYPTFIRRTRIPKQPMGALFLAAMNHLYVV